MIRKAFSLITIEPTVFLRAVGLYIVIGSAIRSELLLQKICRKDLGYNATVCENLEADENEDIENQGRTDLYSNLSEMSNKLLSLISPATRQQLRDDRPVDGRRPRRHLLPDRGRRV